MTSTKEKNGLSEGVTFETLADEKSQKFFKLQKAFTEFVRLQPYNQVMPKVYLDFEKRIREFETRDDDVWVASFPKCGTTWTEEMVWCILNNLDFDASAATLLDERIPFVEMIGLSDPEILPPELLVDTIDVADKMESPRLMKTHLSVDMIPKGVMEKKNKVVYVTRNPRDACCSFYNHWKIFEGFQGDLDDFAEAFLNDTVGYYSPFFVNVLGYWRLRHEPNVLFITYEEMKKDLASVIRKTAKFLGKEVPEEKMDELVAHLSFDKMKDNPAVNKAEFVEAYAKIHNLNASEHAFMKTGKSGNWKTKLSPEWIQKFEDWEKKWLEGTDLSFKYD